MLDKIDFDKSMIEFIMEYPQSKEVFRDFELDYSYGGTKSIEVATREKNIDLEIFKSLMQKIIDETPPEKLYEDKNRKWENESLINIVNNIEKNHHAFTWKKLLQIEIALNKLIKVHGEKQGNFIIQLENIFKEFKENLEKHLKNEEDTISNYVRKWDEFPASTIGNAIELLQKGNVEIEKRLTQIKDFTSNYELPDYACASFLKVYQDMEALDDNLHIHIHLENTILFPKIKELIN